MRGKRDQDPEHPYHLRIIPAHAGQTTWRYLAVLGGTDHPRACGANAPTMLSNTPSTGSSPRMRGKQRQPQPKPCSIRIIPAHAGQTSPRWLAPSFRTDHPRACGANGLRQAGADLKDGSSPRMRGKRYPLRRRRSSGRIIPAHAGQTGLLLKNIGEIPDHPRACGANDVGCAVNLELVGSSPRMRGKLIQGSFSLFRTRIIPAHAGQTA